MVMAGEDIRTFLRKMPRTVRVGVLPGGMSEFITIQAAINYAATQAPTAANRWTVLIYPGTYTGQVVMSQYVDVVGIDKDTVIVQVTGGQTAFTMANSNRIANLTLSVTADVGGNSYGIEMNDQSGTIEDVNIILTRTAQQAYGICDLTIADTARTIRIRNVRITSTGGILCEGIYTSRANKTFYIENSWVRVVDGLALTGASTVYSDHNHWEGSGSSVTLLAAGVIYMFEDSLIGTITQTDGTITYRDGLDVYHVFAGMRVGDAIANATAGTRTTIGIHPGVYAESNLTMKNLVDLVGDDPENCRIVASDAANPIITVPNGVTCTIQGVRVENTSGAGNCWAVRVTGGTLTLRRAAVAHASVANFLGALHLDTTPSTVTVEDSLISGPIPLSLRNVAHTFLAKNTRFMGGNYLAYMRDAAYIATFINCDGNNVGTFAVNEGTAHVKGCTRWGATLVPTVTLNIDQTDASSAALSANGATVVGRGSAFASITGNNNAATSITLDDACSISGTITNIHASATLILPRKRLGVGLGAPGLLADATQMDSVAGAGAPINQAPATRTTTDWARTVKVVHVGVASAFPYNITLTGTAMLKGALVAVTEVIAVTGAGTFRGVVPWHNISNWTSSGNITAGDTVALQMDSRLGLEHRLRDATHLLACRKSPGGAAPLYRTPGSFTLDLTNYTIEETGVAVVAGDNYEYWVVKG